MTNEQVRAMAQIIASQARVIGMQAKNTHRLSLGYSIAYDEDSFFGEAKLMEELGNHIINCPE